jgi:hypothetical protein
MKLDPPDADCFVLTVIVNVTVRRILKIQDVSVLPKLQILG